MSGIKLHTEIINGEEMVVMKPEEFNKQFKAKRVSAKQRILEENGIDLKYLKRIQFHKKTGTFSFKITNIPSIDELKSLLEKEVSYE